MKNKLAIFDLDGTLFDTSEVNYLSYKKALNELGYDIDHDYFVSYCNGRYYKDFLKDMVNHNEEILTKIHKLKKEYYKDFLNYSKENIHLFNIINLIKNDYHIALVTTASKNNAFEILKHFNRFELFDLILTQEDIKKKPDPDGFNKAMKFFNVSFENTIIFEDSDVGLQAAKSSKANTFKIITF